MDISFVKRAVNLAVQRAVLYDMEGISKGRHAEHDVLKLLHYER